MEPLSLTETLPSAGRPGAHMTARQEAIVRTLLYFDVFDHPLRIEEVRGFAGCEAASPAEVRNDLETLCGLGLIRAHGGHYGFGDIGHKLASRQDDEARAARRMRKARRMSSFIGRFPFVRAVMVSGSMSKGRLPADGDIDYFVITEPGRLWIARTLLIGFKKLFLFNSRRDFCVNYFVDLGHLSIEDRNLFTATEVLTLIPTYNGPLCAAFFQENRWASALLPNRNVPTTDGVRYHHGPIKRLGERLFRNGLGDELDEWCMLRTLHHWRHKFAEFDRKRFELALRTRKYVSKHHPRNFQQRVLDAYAARIARCEQEHHISLQEPVLEPSSA